MYLGIDLGTSNSAIVGNDGAGLRLFKTSDGRDVLPSVIYVDKRGHRFVGSKAYDQALLAPQNVAQGFKRLMGTKTPLHMDAADLDIEPEEASAEVIRTLLTQARAEAGDFPLEGSVVTVPAAFNQMQSEATIRAAQRAGLQNVGLLQEPIAAALASLERASSKDGQFLVYDLGGGTFDVALVQSIKGAVTILAHEGINMLGGRDFDKTILNSVIRPWLLSTYDLADDFQKQKEFQRLVRLAQLKGEQAKIELSTRETATIFVSEDEARASDRQGEDIYIEVELSRAQLNQLVEERIGESIQLCRKILSDNGLTNDDVDRVVLIGGPSKMPAVRERVPLELGIPVDLNTDPMTAVARGAAIYAEGRVWSGESSSKKSNLDSKQTSGAIKVKYDYEARTAADQVRVKATVTEGDATGYRISALTEDGRESGEKDLSATPSFKVSLTKPGVNVVRMRVLDASGAPSAEASADLSITRTVASSAGKPATQTIAVKMRTGSDELARNHLEPLVRKGDVLPCQGVKPFRAAKALAPTSNDHIAVELFQQEHGVLEPELNLFIGSVTIPASILDEHQQVRQGDEILVHWNVDENGLLKCSVEAPSVGVHVTDYQFYVDQLGHQDFGGETGKRIAGDAVLAAEADIDALEEDLGSKAANEINSLRRRHRRIFDDYVAADDADTFRCVAEESRHIRQEVSRVRHSEPFRSAAASAELLRLTKAADELLQDAPAAALERIEQIKSAARRFIAERDFDGADRAIDELAAVIFIALRQQPAFVAAQFQSLAQARHLAIDEQLHDRLVQRGLNAVDSDDFDELRQVTAELHANRAVVETPSHDLATLAGLMAH